MFLSVHARGEPLRCSSRRPPVGLPATPTREERARARTTSERQAQAAAAPWADRVSSPGGHWSRVTFAGAVTCPYNLPGSREKPIASASISGEAPIRLFKTVLQTMLSCGVSRTRRCAGGCESRAILPMKGARRAETGLKGWCVSHGSLRAWPRQSSI